MTIETLTAREIVTQLAETIGQNINIMNTEGVIIASSDPERGTASRRCEKVNCGAVASSGRGG